MCPRGLCSGVFGRYLDGAPHGKIARSLTPFPFRSRLPVPSSGPPYAASRRRKSAPSRSCRVRAPTRVRTTSPVTRLPRSATRTQRTEDHPLMQPEFTPTEAPAAPAPLVPEQRQPDESESPVAVLEPMTDPLPAAADASVDSVDAPADASADASTDASADASTDASAD